MSDIDKLEALARAATPGPWTASDYGTYDGKGEAWYVDTPDDRADIASDEGGVKPNHWDANRGRRDMQFIAAANPKVVLALIAEVRAWRERFPAHVYRPQDECVSSRLWLQRHDHTEAK